VTISDLVQKLIDAGLVSDQGPVSCGRVGKPANIVSMTPSAGYVLAVDLSLGLTARTAVLDLSGQSVLRREVPIGDTRGAADVEALEQAIRQMLLEAPSPVVGVGIATPGVVETNGVVRSAANLGWVDLPLKQRLEDLIDLPVYVDNDANLAARAEFTFGGANPTGMMLIMVGLGLGAALLLDGVLLEGPTSSAGEIGHVTAVDNGEPCACGRAGCLETVFSAGSLDQIQGDLDKLEQIGATTGTVLAPVVSSLNLNEIVVASPNQELPDQLLQAIAGSIKQRVLPATSQGFLVRPAHGGSESALLGACALVLSRRYGIA